jgi:hypothetical protein
MQIADCRLPNSDGRLASADSNRRPSNRRWSIRAKAVWGGRVRAAAVVLLALLVASCSKAIRTGDSPAYLILTSMTGTPGGGALAGTASTEVASDVITLVPKDTGTPTIFSDTGTATVQLQMKDVLDTPSAANSVTLTQYHVKYIRSDGHNVQGVDVPYEFDGGLGITISNTGSVSFTLVRNQAKQEAPLAALANNFQIISTIAEVTFYGHDQNGNAVNVTGRIDVNFSNWGD